MGEKVGYPEHWRDYARLQIAEGPFVLNVARANAFEWQRTVNRPGNPVDTTEWDITVPTVNAYYEPTKNEMVFPAGALIPQTFDPAADDGANYGSLGGSWAGHELTHGFDDEGRHYDATGNLRDWWIPSDSAHFTQAADLVVHQFDAYIQVDTFHVNGQLTLGENIADYGGILVGYDALERALQRDGRPGPIDGYTPEQRFFLGYAQSWRVHNRDARLRTRVTVDPHAPERWRVNGPLSNSAAFAQAFGCKAGDPMVRGRRAGAPDLVTDRVTGATRRVYLLTRDLLFRGKLGGVVEGAGGSVTRDAAACELAVVELESRGWEERIRDARDRGIPVLAFGSHMNADLLRRARELGAEAVPNSQVEGRVAQLLATST